MRSKFLKIINDTYYIPESCDEYISINGYENYKDLKKLIEKYLKTNKIKVASIYKNYLNIGYDFFDLVFIVLVLYGYKFTNKYFITDMVCKILHRLKIQELDEDLLQYDDYKYEKEEEKKLQDYLIDLIKNNNNVKSYFENELIITDKDLGVIMDDDDYWCTIKSILHNFYSLKQLELYIHPPKIIFNFNIYKEDYNNAIKIMEERYK
jgi:hypothetical protein